MRYALIKRGGRTIACIHVNDSGAVSIPPSLTSGPVVVSMLPHEDDLMQRMHPAEIIENAVGETAHA